MTAHTPRVVVTQRFFDSETVAFLQENGCRVILADLPDSSGDALLDVADLRKLLDDADAWIVGQARVTRELLTELPFLRVIARRGVGYEKVDVEAVRSLRKVATIAVGGNDAAVADHTIGLMLAVARRIVQLHLGMKEKSDNVAIGVDLFEKTVGIIGCGRIGRGVLRRLAGFDTRLLVATAHPDPALTASHGVNFVELETLLRQSDFISLHIPLNEATKGIINRNTIALMKPSAIVINTARGGLVRDDELLEALKAGQIAGAGLDVLLSESDLSYSEVTRALLEMPQVVLTPHIGASTNEALIRTNHIAAQCVLDVLGGREPPAHCVVADGRRPNSL